VALSRPQRYWSGATAACAGTSEQLGLAPAGRLVIDSVVLLVLTLDSRVARS
jgi:16S rRNA U516 pseudouridylate synthase RsuA-like enzyme